MFIFSCLEYVRNKVGICKSEVPDQKLGHGHNETQQGDGVNNCGGKQCMTLKIILGID